MIIVDTGFWLALADEKDTYHQGSIPLLQIYSPHPPAPSPKKDTVGELVLLDSK